MDIQDFVKEKHRPSHTYLQGLAEELNDFIAQKKFSRLSSASIELGLLLLNSVPELRESGYYQIFSEEITAESKRFLKIQEKYNSKTIWEKHYDLLLYFFEKDKAPFVKAAWEMIPQLPYQTGYYRRSFRLDPQAELHFVNQLNFIIDLLNGLQYDFSLSEYALYSNQLYLYNSQITLVWAAALNAGNEEIYQLFLDIVYNRHETAKVSREIIKAMLLSDQEEAWEAVEKLLLSAQRQEGLRQTILECLDETSLGAMRRMIKLILDEKLSRFSSVVRAIDVWAGLGWEGQRETVINRTLEFAHRFLENPALIPQAIESKDNAEVYMALWAQGVYDVEKTLPLINEIIELNNIEKTTLALYFIQQIQLPKVSLDFGLKTLQNAHLQVFTNSLKLLNDNYVLRILPQKSTYEEVFEILKLRLPDVPAKPKVFENQVFGWLNFQISQEDVFRLMIELVYFIGEAGWEKLLPYFEEMGINQRESVTNGILGDYYGYSYKPEEAKKLPPLSKFQRDFAFKILKDRGEGIRTAALRALEKAEMESEELAVFEEMLSRKSGDMRKTVIQLILKQKSNLVQKSVERLVQAKNTEQRLAGLDMLAQIKANQSLDNQWFSNLAMTLENNPKITDQERVILDNLTAKESTITQYTPENGFGLYDPSKITPYQIPQLPTSGEYVERTQKSKSGLGKSILKAITGAQVNKMGLSQSPKQINEALQALKKLVLANQSYEYQYENWDNSQSTALLGNYFEPIKRDTNEMTDEQKFYNYPLAEVWKKWFEDYKLTEIDLFWMNLINSIDQDDEIDEEDIEANLDKRFPRTSKKLNELIFKAKIPQIGTYYWQNPITKILNALQYLSPYPAEIDFLGGLCQTMFCNIDADELNRVVEEKTTWATYYYTWRNLDVINAIYDKYAYKISQMTDNQYISYWQLEKWKNLTIPQEYPKNNQNVIHLSNLYTYTRAFHLKLIGIDELYMRVLRNDAIQELTQIHHQENQYDIKKEFPFLNEILDLCRNRVLEIELKRGDSSTPVTQLAQALQIIFGMRNFFDLLVGLGKENLHRGYIYSWGNHEYNKKEILSTLLKRCQPIAEETQEDFNKAVKSFKISEKRLVEAATYAPQWLKYVSENLGWEKMTAAVWWLHAHTNGYHSAETETEIGKYSKVEIKDFQDGAVDIDWFQEVYQALGKERWQILYDSAKYISDGNGHNRAKLYADVILGNTKMDEVIKRVSEKRNQDYLRVYGLLPLDAQNPDLDVLKRYQYLQKFKKESKQFGSQKQASEALAVRIAMDNLARTAGFGDPMRLTWAMETEEAIQIIQNAKALTINEVSISLEVDEDGKSSIECWKGEKKLKSIPDSLKKEPAIIELKEFNSTLQNQFKRTRKSLEEAMINGDLFKISEIETLMKHPVVSPMLQKLVLKSGNDLGFWQAGQLVSVSGKSAKPQATISIAHCTDLYYDGQWADYQRYCFEKQIKQPFKQIFRELYIPTEDELKEKAVSRRYAGHQVQPKKTVALLKSQGWTVDYSEGLQKVFHQAGFIAKMYALADWFSPADVESPTLETIEFIDRKTWKNVPFAEMSPRIFSEVMRDIDLVVSVAHVGEVDPEASQSSIELRTALVRETLRLFKINNVELKGNHALIEGTKGNYSVHLGSAVVHKLPGIYLSILPVHSQHRGRMFLPFLDEDPKTAELMSKILLLAKDNEIQDPTILRQLG
jgi:hypothetical protein